MVTASNSTDPSPDNTQPGQPFDFDAAFREVSRSAFLLARQLGHGPEKAQDIVQEAALSAWRYRAGRRGPFRPWFLTIVYRLCRRPVLDWLPLPAGWDRHVPPGITVRFDPDLLTALHALPTRQRAALWLRYCEDLSISDVARVMRLRESAAKQLLFRGREALRRKLTTKLEENQ
jgi:RNA polymerase sigma-70 factor (ECF subfamily)